MSLQKVKAKPKQEQRPVQKAPAGPKEQGVQKAPVTPAKGEEKARKAPAAPGAESPMSGAGAAVKLDQPVQKKVGIGAENDPAEKEADQAARKVTSGEKAPPIVQGQGAPVRKAPSGSASPAQEEAAAQAIQKKGSGEPLPSGVRRQLERSMGADLGGVRVHDDAAARKSASDLGARAFTHGNDIWLGPGESKNDVGLMAHEATHVVQQSPAVRRLPNGTSGGTSGSNSGGGSGSASDGTGAAATGGQSSAPTITPEVRQQLESLPLETGRLEGNDTIRFADIPVQGFKRDGHRGTLYGQHSPLKRKKNYQRRGAEQGDPRQRDKWKQHMGTKTATAEKILRQKYKEANNQQEPPPTETLVFQGRNSHGGPMYYFGDLHQVATELTLPNWDANGNAREYHVDHIVELQLGNWDTETWANDPANMELLDASTNMSSGSYIDSRVDDRVRDFIRVSNNALGQGVADIKKNFNLWFNATAAGAGGAVGPELYWTRDQIEQGSHLGPVQVRNLADLGGNGYVRIFGSNGSGQGRQFLWPGAITADERNYIPPFQMTAKEFETENLGADLGTLTFQIPNSNPQLQPTSQTIPVRRIPGARYAGYVDKQAARQFLQGVRAKYFSPIRVDDFDILPNGVYATGAILPEAPFFRNIDLGFELSGGDLQIRKEFASSDFNVPRPFRVTNSSLILSWGTQSGLGIVGQVDFGIERLGQGYLRGGANQRGGVSLEGKFNFDTNMFDQAQIGMWYRNGALGGSGDLRIGPGKVRGIRSGSLHVQFGEGQPFALRGSVQPNIPGVQEGTVTAQYSEEEGLLIGGSLQLSDRIPGIRSGSVEAQLRQSQQGYELGARGTAQPNIPGITSSITVGYQDGIFLAEGQVSYQRGLLSGEVQIGVTNGPVPEAGAPAGAAGDRLRAYGGGEVTLRLAPWLQGTVGVRLLPNGEMEVSGRVGLPSSLNLFEALEYNRNLFRAPSLDIPIVGVAVAGQRVGIFLTITGGLDASASIGPGQLRQLELGVTYNPDRPEATRVIGNAQLHVPAQAGLRLFVRGGIGAGIPIVSASANLEIGGRLGLEGALDAGVQVDWTPSRGLVIDAQGEVMVQPRFTFDVSAMVLVEANLLLTTVELYSRRWNLASFDYGSNMQFGLRFPVYYEEGRPFNISLSDIQFVAPEVDPLDVARGIMQRLTGD